jgi:very-short-patch-repair endonuclease
MNAIVDRYTKQLVEEKGWRAGSTLENRFALRLHRIGIRPTDLLQEHQVGSYRIDFADPDVFLGIEADGFFHRMPGAAEKDRERDAWLLTQGWHVFRISDDCDEHELEERLLCAVLLIREERIYQGLPWKREPRRTRKQTKPSRLAQLAGYRAPAEEAQP